MIDAAYWMMRLCDVCRKDESVLQSRLVGIMENGHWVGKYTKEKVQAARSLRAEWEQEIARPCLVFKTDMDEVVICEKHLLELLDKKKELQTHAPSS
jgi:hypothetical protein